MALHFISCMSSQACHFNLRCIAMWLCWMVMLQSCIFLCRTIIRSTWTTTKQAWVLQTLAEMENKMQFSNMNAVNVLCSYNSTFATIYFVVYWTQLSPPWIKRYLHIFLRNKCVHMDIWINSVSVNAQIHCIDMDCGQWTYLLGL